MNWGYRTERQIHVAILVAAARRRMKIKKGERTPSRVLRFALAAAAEHEARERPGGRRTFRRKRAARRRRRQMARDSRRRNRGR